MWATARAAQEPWLEGARVRVASAEEIERRCGSASHQGMCARRAGIRTAPPARRCWRARARCVVALDQIQDPQNLGSICRSAECAGADGVVIPERRAAEVTAAVCKASAGAVEHLRARARAQPRRLPAGRAQGGCWCYGASAARDRSVPYDAPDYSEGGVVLVLGSEGKGLRPRVAKACDELISLPLRGRIESLGVAAAGAALLYEILQKRSANVDKAP